MVLGQKSDGLCCDVYEKFAISAIGVIYAIESYVVWKFLRQSMDKEFR